MIQEDIQVREATIHDLPLLKHWDEQPHVIASDPNDEWNWEFELNRKPEWRAQLIAEVEGRAIGFMQLINPAREDSHYWGDVADHLMAIDIWIGEEEDLGRGYGTAMMNLAIDRCFKNKSVSAIIIDPLVSNVKAHRFYERLGFKFVENRMLNEDFCSVYELSRKNWHNKHRLETKQV